MYAGCLFGNRHIETIIHQNARRTRPPAEGFLKAEQGCARECCACPCGEILFAELNPIDTGSYGGFDISKQRLVRGRRGREESL